MKIISRFKTMVMVAALVLGVSSCNDDDEGNTVDPTTSITAKVTEDTDLSILLAALTAADGDLPTVLSGNGPFTVLAPTNAAFEAYLAANDDYDELGDIPTDVLQQILLNHVITGASLRAADFANLETGYAITQATASPDDSNISLFFDGTNGVKFNGISTVTEADIVASNGVIHKVDAVIDLPNLTTFVAIDPNLSSLLGALNSVDFVETVAALPKATIFAPNDEAFGKLTTVPSGEALTTILQHHVVNDSNALLGGLMDGQTLTPLAGGNITVNIPGNDSNPAKLTDGAGNMDIDIILANIQAENGVIHIVETVLTPEM